MPIDTPNYIAAAPRAGAWTGTFASPPAGCSALTLPKIEAEENLDSKYLLRTSDPHLSAEDAALGYKQLPEVSAAAATSGRSST